jgi:hypothetical protein
MNVITLYICHDALPAATASLQLYHKRLQGLSDCQDARPLGGIASTFEE